MKSVFADTFYFLALLDSREESHLKAVEFSRDPQLILVSEALTGDHHFLQAGFTALLK